MQLDVHTVDRTHGPDLLLEDDALRQRIVLAQVLRRENHFTDSARGLGHDSMTSLQ